MLMQDNNNMTTQENTQQEKEGNEEFFKHYFGKRIHLHLKNKYYYFCEINRIRDFDGKTFVEVFDLKKKVYQLISFDTISKMEVDADGN